MKRMSEREAWLWMASAFQKSHRVRVGNITWFCLCHVLGGLEMERAITSGQRGRMKAKIMRALLRKDSNLTYMFPRTKDGAKKRAAFCRKMARECAKKGGKK